MTELTWIQFQPDTEIDENFKYADADVCGHSVRYYVHIYPDNHPIKSYRSKWTADIDGMTLFEYRPASTPIFHESMERAKEACERDLQQLRERWLLTLEISKNTQVHISFANTK